jgi:cytochrome c peroxidase
MRRIGPLILGILLSLSAVAAGCGGSVGPEEEPADEGWQWELPPGFPEPKVPDDNPMSEAKVELGRHLFYDKRLSGNQVESCASCHHQEMAFTDGRAHSIGTTGEVHPRGAMSLANVAYATTLNWANPAVTSLRRQALTPMFGEEPVELGLESRAQVLERLRASRQPDYRQMFQRAFPDADEPITLDRLTKSLATFQRTLISANSPFDDYMYRGQDDALTDSQKRGMDLFFGERLECFHCHGGFNFADATEHAGSSFTSQKFHNNGLYNIDGLGAYPHGNQGVYEITGDPDDRGRFKAPTLRNIAVTAPYMHDGSLETLEEVVDHYARGGRRSPLKSELIDGFVLSDRERQDLINFLKALTDRQFLENPRFSRPAP